MPFGCLYSILHLLRGIDQRTHGRPNGCVGAALIVTGIVFGLATGLVFVTVSLVVFGIIATLFGTGANGGPTRKA